jgi:hypothetical protein
MSNLSPNGKAGRTTARSALVASSLALMVAAPALAQAGSAADAATPSSVSNQVSGRNLVANGSFEQGSVNWKATPRTTMRIKKRVLSDARFARVRTTVRQAAVLSTRRDAVTSTRAGDTFRVSAQVRTNRPGVRGVLRANETKGAATRVSRQSFRIRSTSWQPVSFTVRTTTDGGELRANVKAFSLRKGTTFDVDRVTVTRIGTAAAPVAPAPVAAAAAVDPAGWALKYATNFSSLTGWTVYDGQTQNNDNSVNLAKNVTASAGGLNIRSARESGYSRPFTSGELVGKSSSLVVGNYFRAEVTGTFKDESGVWPCLLWFRPNNASDGEIDVMEWMGGMWTGTQKRVAITMHNEYGATQDSIKKPLMLSQHTWYNPALPHTYTVEKVPGMITVWVDGHKIASMGPANKSWWNRIMEVSGRTWYPRITSQIGQGSATKVVPNPAASWSSTNMKVTSFKLWNRS